MKDIPAEHDSLMEKIVREYGGLIKAAVAKAACGQPWADDIISEVYFAVLLTVRKFGADWTPPRSFLFAVIRNKVNDFLRQKYRDIRRVEEMKARLQEQRSEKEEVLSRVHVLTASEFRVFRLLGLGMTNCEIAENLHISQFTVRSHMKKIHAKCAVRDRAKLALIAYQVCLRTRAEDPGREDNAPEPPGPRHKSAQGLSERPQAELRKEDPSASPVAVEIFTRYIS
jgi:RNA polymerase sigma factor (sigma-70 family)